jgi:hypothetical protein
MGDLETLMPELVDQYGKKLAGDAVVAESWIRRNLVKLHIGAIATGWGVFEWLAPIAANKVHQFVLHIFWGDFVHKLFHIAK